MPANDDAKIRNLEELLFLLVKNRQWEKTLIIGEYLDSLHPRSIVASQALGFAALNLGELDGASTISRMQSSGEIPNRRLSSRWRGFIRYGTICTGRSSG